MKKYLTLLLFIGLFSITRATPISSLAHDSIRVSLLTCSPGDVIYTLFGHTAIRVSIPSRNYDAVYNYGIFNFNTPNFLGKFILGNTDYQLGKTPLYYFLAEYDADQRSVWEQELNLNSSEKMELVSLLEDNYEPHNRYYRYNFFYDNCATRPIVKIQEATTKNLILREPTPQKNDLASAPYSFRSLVHKYSKNYPWSQFGMDLLLGSEADKVIQVDQKIFAPLELMEVMKVSTLGAEPLIKNTQILVDNEGEKTNSQPLTFPFTPRTTFTFLMLLLAVCSFWEFKKRRSFWGIDLALFSIYGLIGSILLFMVCCSNHPAVSPNYLLLLFHPLHLIFAPILISKKWIRLKKGYHYANFTVLAFFIAFYWLIPQYISLTILTLAGSLLIRSLTHILIQAKK